jgi:hypothetical protein
MDGSIRAPSYREVFRTSSRHMAYMRRARTFRLRWDTAALLAATVLVVAIDVACAVLGFATRVDYGLTVLPTGEVYAVWPEGAARAAGVAAGNFVVPRPARGDVVAGFRAGAPREGKVMHLATRRGVVSVSARHSAVADALVSALNLAANSVFVGCAAFVYLRRRGGMAFALWLFAVGSVVAGSTQNPLIAVLPDGAAIALSLIIGGWALFAVPISLILFALRFPSGRIAPQIRAIDTALWIAFPVVLAAGACLLAASDAQYVDYYTAYWIFGGCGQLVVVGLLVLVFRYARMKAIERARTVWALAAFGGSMLAIEANVVGAVIQTALAAHVDDAVNAMASRIVISLSTLSELFPLLAIYPILRHRLFDLGFVVNRATLYSVLTLAAVATLAGVNWLAQRIVSERLAVFIQPIAAIVIGLGYLRVRAWTQSLIERTLFRERFRAETQLAALAESFALERRVEVIDSALATTAVTALALTSGAVFRRSDASLVRTAGTGWEPALRDAIAAPDGDVRRLLDLDGLPAAPNEPTLVIPLVNGADLIGVVFYGRHVNQTEIDPEETAMLRDLCNSAATAYRVAELQSEVAELRGQLMKTVPITRVPT